MCAPGESLLTGVVADLLSRRPMPGSTVTVQRPASYVRQVVGRGTAGPEGRYLVCVGEPAADWEIVAELDTLVSNRVRIPPDGVVDTLYIVGSEAVAISGTVRDHATGDPVEGARITITNRRVRVTTDDEGEFTFRGLGGGPIILTTERIGYAERSDTVLARSGAFLNLDLTLGADAIELEPVVVTARTPPSTRVRGTRELGMTSAQVDSALHRSINFVALLRQANIPGLQIRGEAASGYCIEFLRVGAGCSMLALFVNGVRISNPSVWVADIDPTIVKEFVVLRPAFAQFQYMNAPNGVLDITLR